MAIRVLLADDHRMILEALERTFAEVEGIEIVGMANDGRQVVPLIARTNPDLVLLDMRMPEMDGLTCLERIRKQHPR
ncbi:MAG TPA: response regulator, partial [Gaiellaceae bacterium]|nr:response regulator [Gaiellaceae bacterium]